MHWVHRKLFVIMLLAGCAYQVGLAAHLSARGVSGERVQKLDAALKYYRGNVEFRYQVGPGDPSVPITVVPTGEELYEDPYDDGCKRLAAEATYIPLLGQLPNDQIWLLERAVSALQNGEKLKVLGGCRASAHYEIFKLLPEILRHKSLFDVTYTPETIPLLGGLLKALRTSLDGDVDHI